jgi:hypothetical protein
MQSQPSISAVVNANETGMSPDVFSASGIVLPSVDFIRAIGGSSGIALALTPMIYLAGDPTKPTRLYQVYHAMKIDSGPGVINLYDASGAEFNGTSLGWDLVDQWQWVIACWNGSSWECFGGN